MMLYFPTVPQGILASISIKPAAPALNELVFRQVTLRKKKEASCTCPQTVLLLSPAADVNETHTQPWSLGLHLAPLPGRAGIFQLGMLNSTGKLQRKDQPSGAGIRASDFKFPSCKPRKYARAKQVDVCRVGPALMALTTHIIKSRQVQTRDGKINGAQTDLGGDGSHGGQHLPAVSERLDREYLSFLAPDGKQ